MTDPTPALDPPPDDGPGRTLTTDETLRAATRRQVRGSSLFVVGRVLSLAINFVAQLVVARYLAQAEYGAFAYALSLVSLAEVGVTLGLDRAVPRFVPIHEERGEWSRVSGTLVLVGGTILALGAALVLIVLVLGRELTGRLIDDELAGGLVLILVVLAPVQALDTMLMNLFAVFASPRAIFVRKYLLAPGLRLAVVALLVLGGFGATFLAGGYVVAALIGVILYGGVLVRLLAKRGILARLRASRPELPTRAILAYTVPLLTTDAVYLVLNTVDALVLGAAHGVDAVGALRVVGPLAGLNAVVSASFALLFTPAAARLFARSDRAGMNELYWQTTVWMAVLSFPVFAVTFSLAEPITVFLYEERYAGSAAVLAVLAAGRYVDAAFGLNGLTLRVWGNVRFVVIANTATALIDFALLVVLVPPFGALGAAVATAAALIAFNVMRQAFLWRATGVAAFDRRQLPIYLTITLAAGLLLGVQVATDLPLIAGIALAGLASLAVLAVGRERLAVMETFPELARVPVVGRIVGRGRSRG